MQPLIHILVGLYTATSVTRQTLQGFWSMMPQQIVEGISGSLLLQYKQEHILLPISFPPLPMNFLRADYGSQPGFTGEGVMYLSDKMTHLKSAANPLWTEGNFGTLLITANCCVKSVLTFCSSNDKSTFISTSSPDARSIGSLQEDIVQQQQGQIGSQPCFVWFFLFIYTQKHTHTGLL